MLKSYFIEHKKLCIITLCIIIAIIIGACIFIFVTHTPAKKVEFITVNSRDNLYSLTLPTTLNYTVGNSNETLSLDIYDSLNEVYVYGNTIEKSHEIDLYDVICEDKNSYFASKQNVTEVSGVHEITLDNCSGYEYSMTYLDEDYGKEFYCNVVWIQTSSNIIIVNFEVPNDKLENFKQTFEDIKVSFKLIT